MDVHRGVSKQTAVTAGYGRLTLGESATTLCYTEAVQESKGFMLCKIWAVISVFSWEMDFRWSQLELRLVSYPGRTHCFAQSVDNPLISG